MLQLLTVVVPHARQAPQGGRGRAAEDHAVHALPDRRRSPSASRSATSSCSGPSRAAARSVVENFTFGRVFVIVMTLTAGCVLLMWLGELITQRGIGNGISLMIFASIASRHPERHPGLVDQPGPGLQGDDAVPRAGDHRRHRLHAGGPAPHPGPVREARGGAPDGRRRLHLPAAAREHGRRDPGHLRRLADGLPADGRDSSSRPTGRRTSRPSSTRTTGLPDRRVDPDHRLHLLLHGGHVQPRGAGRQPEEVRRVHPGGEARQTHGRIPRPHPRAAHVPGRALPRRGRGAADDPDQPDGRELLLRRHLDPDRRRRGARHDEAARGAADDAQLRGLPQVSERQPGAARPSGSREGHAGRTPAEDFDLPYYATGIILREAVEAQSELGKKAKEYMDARRARAGRADLRGDRGAARLGRGRRRLPARRLPAHDRPGRDARAGCSTARGRELTAVLLIDAPDEEVVRRLSGRRTCVKNGHVYHVEFDPPKHEGVCDQDGSRLIQRDDDKPETVQNRLAVYHEQTEPLIDWYEERGLLRRFDGTRTPEEVHEPHPCDTGYVALEDDDLVIQLQDPRGDRADGGRRPDPGALPRDPALEGAPGRDHGRARRGRRALHPLAGRRARVQGLPRLPGLDLRVAELDGGARHPGLVRAAARRHPLDRHRRGAGRLGGRRRDHPPDRQRHADRHAAAGHHPRRAVRRRRAVPCRATAWGTSRTRSRRAWRRDGFAVIRSLVGHGIGRDMHEDPQIPNFGDPGTGPELEEGMVLAIEPMVNVGTHHVRMGRTTGRSTPRTARWRPTSSTPSPSRATARASSRRGTSWSATASRRPRACEA